MVKVTMEEKVKLMVKIIEDETPLIKVIEPEVKEKKLPQVQIVPFHIKPRCTYNDHMTPIKPKRISRPTPTCGISVSNAGHDFWFQPIKERPLYIFSVDPYIKTYTNTTVDIGINVEYCDENADDIWTGNAYVHVLFY